MEEGEREFCKPIYEYQIVGKVNILELLKTVGWSVTKVIGVTCLNTR